MTNLFVDYSTKIQDQALLSLYSHFQDSQYKAWIFLNLSLHEDHLSKNSSIHLNPIVHHLWTVLLFCRWYSWILLGQLLGFHSTLIELNLQKQVQGHLDVPIYFLNLVILNMSYLLHNTHESFLCLPNIIMLSSCSMCFPSYRDQLFTFLLCYSIFLLPPSSFYPLSSCFSNYQ